MRSDREMISDALVRSWFRDIEYAHVKVRCPDDAMCSFVAFELNKMRKFWHWDPQIIDILGQPTRQRGLAFANKLKTSRVALVDLEISLNRKNKFAEELEELEVIVREFLDRHTLGTWSGKDWKTYAVDIAKLARTAWTYTSDKAPRSDDAAGPIVSFVCSALHALGEEQKVETIRDALRKRTRSTKKVGAEMRNIDPKTPK